MTNKPEPVVTQEDHAAAKQFESDIGCSLFSDDLQLLAEAFAAHRTAAVARREAEIVELLEQLHEDYGDAGYYKGTFILVSIKSLIDKIQNGGGA